MLGTGSDGFYAYSASNADMNAIVATLSNELQPIRPAITAQEPYLLDKVTSMTGTAARSTGSSGKMHLWRADTCAALAEMLRNNVQTVYGQSRFGDLPVCAKSGTAEVGGGQQPHAWFAGFVDDPDHPLAFVVLVENGGWGSQTAGGVAAKVLTQAAAG